MNVQSSVHEGKKPFECRLCGMKFIQKSALMKHVSSVHKKSNPQKVPYKTQTKAPKFSAQRQLPQQWEDPNHVQQNSRGIPYTEIAPRNIKMNSEPVWFKSSNSPQVSQQAPLLQGNEPAAAGIPLNRGGNTNQYWGDQTSQSQIKLISEVCMQVMKNIPGMNQWF